MKITCKMEEVDEKLAELMDTLDDVDMLEVEDNEESKIVAYGYKILIPSLDLYARAGEMMVYDEDEEDWYADFSLTIIYSDDDELLYWEQDDTAVSLYNFLTANNRISSIEDVYNLECIIAIDDAEA